MIYTPFEAAALQTVLIIWALGCLITYVMAEWHMVSPPNPPTGKIRRVWFVARFDKWMGLYEVDGTESKDYRDKTAYWFPLPCVGVKMTRENV